MKILLRLDDFSPNRDINKWQRIETILDKFSISPLIAVIPNDCYFGNKVSDENYWDEIRRLNQKNYEIAVHGWNHCVKPINDRSQSELFFSTKSEFVDLSYDEIRSRLIFAFQKFKLNGIESDIFVAPNHGFSSEVIRALADLKFVKYNSDGISFRLNVDRGLIWVPQYDWKIPKFGFGLRTVCLHPSTMAWSEIDGFEKSIPKHAHRFIKFSEIRLQGNIHQKNVIDNFYYSFFKFLVRSYSYIQLICNKQ